MHFLRFLFSKYFYLNILIALILTAGLVFATIKWMGDYTNNGYSKALPDFSGIHLKDLKERFEQEKLRFIILDTITSDAHPKGVVVDQTPKAFSLVKDNRTVYLTVNSMENEKVRMPNLTDGGTKMALRTLKSRGLELDSIWNVPGSHDGLVIAQLYEGKEIVTGKLINKGSKIVLKVSRQNIHTQKIMLPDFSELTMKEAIDKAKINSLNLVIICSDCVDREDSLKAVARQQAPSYSKGKKIWSGSQIDVFFDLSDQ